MCLYCWKKLANFHEFYNTVNNAKNIYLTSFWKNEQPQFIEVKCDPFRCDANIPPVRTETIARVAINAPPQHLGVFGDGSNAYFAIANFENEKLGVECNSKGSNVVSAVTASHLHTNNIPQYGCKICKKR